MRMLRRGSLLVVLMLIGVHGVGQEPGGVRLKVVRYEGLKDAVLRNRGKVILIDFWGEFCAPCKINFPHVVQLHRQFAQQGLVVISVSVDDLRQGNPDETLRRIRGFLQTQGADFTNLVLDEPVEFRADRLRLNSVPCCYVFNRQGKWTQFGGGSDVPNFQAIDRLIVDLLRER